MLPLQRLQRLQLLLLLLLQFAQEQLQLPLQEPLPLMSLLSVQQQFLHCLQRGNLLCALPLYSLGQPLVAQQRRAVQCPFTAATPPLPPLQALPSTLARGITRLILNACWESMVFLAGTADS